MHGIWSCNDPNFIALLCLLVVRGESQSCSTAAFCVCACRCIKAINETFHLHFPTTPQEIEKAARGFESVSSHRVIEGCVAALDGLLIKIKVPSSREQVGRVKAFFSGCCHTCDEISKLPVTQIANLFVHPHCVLVEPMICQLARDQNFQTWLEICPCGGAHGRQCPLPN